ncbi:MAG: GtrA family protein [SAR324 cluster bacterium]|nr:GtrA family protein [SAR324 cluster bacterium]
MSKILENPLFKKFLRFLSGGGLIWGLRAILTSIMTEWFLMDPVIAYRIGLAISFVLYFFMNLHFIFQVKDNLLLRLMKYSCVSFTFLTTDGLLMQFFHRSLEWHYFLALSASTGILLIVKFFIYDKLVFQKTKTPNTQTL